MIFALLWLSSKYVWLNRGLFLFLENSSKSSAKCGYRNFFAFLSDRNGGTSGRKVYAQIAFLGYARTGILVAPAKPWAEFTRVPESQP